MADQAGRTFDVLVVGSGASGGWAAKRLAEAGLKVGLLDAGRALSPSDYTEHKPAFELPYRNKSPKVIRKTRPLQKDCYACSECNYDWFATTSRSPTPTPEGKPFSWQGRTRVVGGRTNVWGRQSYRFSDLDFKAASYDGFGEDWPLWLRRPRALLRPRRGLRRHHRDGGGRLRAARRQVPSADGHALRGAARPKTGSRTSWAGP